MLLSYVAVKPVPFFNINSVSVVALVYVTVNEIYAVGDVALFGLYPNYFANATTLSLKVAESMNSSLTTMLVLNAV